MISTGDLRWAAGFLEGEGCFGIYGRGKQRGRRQASISAGQANREPLEKLVRLFGGTIHRASGSPLTKKICWQWRISCGRAIGTMMTLYSLLSQQRRERIQDIIAEWRKSNGVQR